MYEISWRLEMENINVFEKLELYCNLPEKLAGLYALFDKGPLGNMRRYCSHWIREAKLVTVSPAWGLCILNKDRSEYVGLADKLQQNPYNIQIKM